MSAFNKIKHTILFSALLLSACKTIPEATELPSPTVTEFNAHRVQALHAEVNQDDAWWTTFGDPALNQLVEMVLSSNLDLQQAEARLRQSRALVDASRASLLPNGGVELHSLTQQYSRDEMPFLPADARRSDLGRVGLSFAWEADVFGRLRARTRADQFRLAGVAAESAALRLEIAAETASAWFELEGLREQLRINNQLQESWRQSLELARLRIQTGSAAPMEATRLEVELAAVAADQPHIESAIARVTNRLATLAGQPVASFVAPESAAVAAHPSTVYIPEPAQWAKQRPDLVAAEALMQAAALDAEAVKAEFLPRLSIGGVLGYAAGSLSSLGSGSSASWFLVPAISVPLFDRPRIQARADFQVARQREAFLVWQQQTLLAAAEVEDALTGVVNGRAVLQANEQRRAAAAAVFAEGQARYRIGVADLLELLDLQRSEQQAEIALAAAHTLQRQAIVSLHLALASGIGGPGM